MPTPTPKSEAGAAGQVKALEGSWKHCSCRGTFGQAGRDGV